MKHLSNRTILDRHHSFTNNKLPPTEPGLRRPGTMAEAAAKRFDDTPFVLLGIIVLVCAIAGTWVAFISWQLIRLVMAMFAGG
jgi:hypothetical protein